MMREPNVLTVPQTTAFLDTVAESILNGSLPGQTGAPPDHLDLPQITLLLPTRRACRSMNEAFLRVSGGKALLLPRIRPIGEIDEDRNLLTSSASYIEGTEDDLTIPPAIGDLERRLVLTQLVMKWVDTLKEAGSVFPRSTPAQASALAGELASLMDEVETEKVDFSRLEDLVPDSFSQHWQLTLQFLKIVTEHWPNYLAGSQMQTAVKRRNALLASEAGRLRAGPPDAPVIAAGVTGSIPETANLLNIIARLPQGAVVLPGLDMQLDEESWEKISSHPEHPQYGMRKLLDKLDTDRSNVGYLKGGETDAANLFRLKLISETLRPSDTTELWQNYISDPGNKSLLKDSLGDVVLVEAPKSQDEAEAISLILRQAAESPGVRAALVTPDRILGRRVAVRLEKWGLVVDDSAGRPLSKTVPGVFLDLIVETFKNDFSPASLMSLLKHPLTRLGLKAGEARGSARSLELLALRQPLLGTGLGSIARKLEKVCKDLEQKKVRHKVIRRIGKFERERERAQDLLDRLQSAFEPLTKFQDNSRPLKSREFAEAHIAVAEALSEGPDGTSDRLWAGDAGEAVAIFFASLLDEAIPNPELLPSEYPDFYRSLIAGQAMREHTPVHPRLSIWGPMEARLQQADIVILGGLNEGTWPDIADSDPWLSRPMREKLGLPAPEQAIGLSAHDFGQLLGGTKIFLTRASKIDGVPTVPSRWLLRLQVLLEGAGLGDSLTCNPSEPWLQWAQFRDAVQVRKSIAAPKPTPPVKCRPRHMSVTRIEEWIRNPYSIYARYILDIEKLTDLGDDPDAATRGDIIHRSLNLFTLKYPIDLPDDPAGELVKIADDILAEFDAHPRIVAFWRPRFFRFAEWFAETEAGRRDRLRQIATEISGSMIFDAPGGPFTLSARADRIDIFEDNTAIVFDYKSGSFPNDAKVKSFRSPQLPLEALILANNGFENLSGLKVKGLHYISATGGEPPGEEHAVRHDDFSQLAGDAFEGLHRLVSDYDNQGTPYSALRRSRFDYRFDDYAHLARVKEWSATDESEG